MKNTAKHKCAFMQMQRKQDYVAPDAASRHVHEFLQLMAAMTGDNRSAFFL